jgi:uncharacterized sulfatase
MRPLIALTLLLATLAPASDRPNFVWIIADDMSPDTDAYGLSDVHTPHLDRLATEGRLYQRAYATAPVCSSSRSAFILGCYQTTTGLHPHDMENPQPLPAPYRHLPGLLQDAGYFVTNTAAPGTERNGRVIKKGKTHYNFAHDAKEMFDGDDWRQRQPDQPFFAQFQITEPHRPFPIPASYDEAKLSALKLPANYPDTPLIRRDWYAYQRSVEVVDQRVGVILDQLQTEGVLENTIVMFFADHGRPMPWGKQWLSIEGLHVPLIVRGPSIPAAGIEPRLVSLIDLAPSLLQLAGLPIPSWMEGRALFGPEFPERDSVFAARDRCGDAMDRIRAVIGRDQLFVRNFHPELSHLNWSSYKEEQYPGLPLMRTLHAAGKLAPAAATWMQPQRSETELYDLQHDPLGLTNLSADPGYQTQLNQLSTTLETWITTSNDQGGTGDPTTEPALQDIQKSKRATYQRVWQKRLGQPEPTDAERLAWWEQSYGLPSKENLP